MTSNWLNKWQSKDSNPDLSRSKDNLGGRFQNEPQRPGWAPKDHISITTVLHINPDQGEKIDMKTKVAESMGEAVIRKPSCSLKAKESETLGEGLIL